MIKKLLVLLLIFVCNFTYAQDSLDSVEDIPEASTDATPDIRMVKFRDIVITSSYGAFVGAITGLALLAFVSNPGSKLKYIAVGGSLGLYAGTILGVYLSFGVSLPTPSDPDLEEYDFDEEYGLLENNYYEEFNNVKSQDLSRNDIKLQVPVLVYNF